MDKTIKYKIISHDFGAPPIGCIMEWDGLYDAWTVTDAYNTGSSCKSIWWGNPEDFPELYKPIDDILPKKKLRYPHIFNTLDIERKDIYL
jgi:hypothetical protein